jgi:hypothetical protein
MCGFGANADGKEMIFQAADGVSGPSEAVSATPGLKTETGYLSGEFKSRSNLAPSRQFRQ